MRDKFFYCLSRVFEAFGIKHYNLINLRIVLEIKGKKVAMAT